MSQQNAYTDVVELCALLQCLGFSIKSLETTDVNVSQDIPSRTVIINCQTSGFHVVLESAYSTCSCPMAPSQQNSGFWEVSGVTGGKQYTKEYGSTLLGSLPNAHREQLTIKLQDIVRYIKQHNESDGKKQKEGIGNKSASMIDLKTPEKGHLRIKSETPTRYRSLDTLTTGGAAPEELPAPGLLLKDTTEDNADGKKMQLMCQRQSTYTLSSEPGSSRRRDKTSSPIPPSSFILESLISAEKTAVELRSKISNIIKEFVEDCNHDSSISSLALDVSKISVLKGTESSKIQFSSSPNLSGLGVQHEFTKRLKRIDSASTSNLAKPVTKDEKTSKLRKLSPNIFKLKHSISASKSDKEKSTPDNKSSKLNSLFKPKIITSVRVPKTTPDTSAKLNSSRKKFSNVKSTIPRPASKKE